MFRRNRRCYCINNDFQNNLREDEGDIMEKSYMNVSSSCSNDSEVVDCCECGFDEENDIFPENPMLAQSYVPIQYMDKTFRPSIGLKMGTIFPELVSPYVPCQNMREMSYIESTNIIGKGCNG